MSQSKRNTTTVCRGMDFCIAARHHRENKRIEARMVRQKRQEAKRQEASRTTNA